MKMNRRFALAISGAALSLSSTSAFAAPTAQPTPISKDPVHTADTFELRATVEAAAPNTQALKSRDDGQMVNVLVSPILTLADASRASVRKSGSQSVLHLELKNDGFEKLRDFTKTHSKEKMAIVVNDQLMSTPTVADSVDKQLDVKLPSSVDAQKLADAVNSGGKERPTTR